MLVVERHGGKPPQKALSKEWVAQARRHSGNHVMENHVAYSQLTKSHIYRLINRAIREFCRADTTDIALRHGPS